MNDSVNTAAIAEQKIITNRVRAVKKVEAKARYFIALATSMERREALLGLEDLVDEIVKLDSAYVPVGGYQMTRSDDNRFIAEQTMWRK